MPSWPPGSCCRTPSGLDWPTSGADIPRLDAELVRRGLARSRGHARDLIRQGHVEVAGTVVTKGAAEVSAATDISLLAPRSPWVNRGAEKLQHALDEWGVPVAGRRALDVGASTGGFTQVLLQAGARHVTALDVGHGQLHPILRRDPRVENREGASIRDLDPDSVHGIGVVVADLSFISLRLVLPVMRAVLEPDGDMVLLVKPQFEVGRERLGKHGVVTSPDHRAQAIRDVIAAARDLGLHVHGLIRSPVRGTHGNREYLLWLRPEASGRMDPATIADLATATTRDE